MLKRNLFIIALQLLLIPFLTGQTSMVVSEQPEMHTYKALRTNRAKVVFISPSDSYHISAGKSRDLTRKWYKNDNGLYEYTIELDISSASKRRFIVVSEITAEGFEFTATFEQGEIRYYTISEPEIYLLIKTIPCRQKFYEEQGKACIDIFTTKEGLKVESSPLLNCSIKTDSKKEEDKYIYTTSVIIDVQRLDSLRNQYKEKEGGILEQINTLYVFFDKSNSVPITLDATVVSKDKICYQTVIIEHNPPKDTLIAKPNETFLTLNASCSFIPFWSCGFKVGQMKKIVGWYVSCMSNFNFKGAFHPFAEGEQYDLTGKTKTTRISAIGGIVIRLAKPVAIHAGVGFGYFAQTLETQTGDWYALPKKTYLGADVALGLSFHIKQFMLSLEAVTTNFKTVEMKAGFGFALPTPSKHRK